MEVYKLSNHNSIIVTHYQRQKHRTRKQCNIAIYIFDRTSLSLPYWKEDSIRGLEYGCILIIIIYNIKMMPKRKIHYMLANNNQKILSSNFLKKLKYDVTSVNNDSSRKEANCKFLLLFDCFTAKIASSVHRQYRYFPPSNPFSRLFKKNMRTSFFDFFFEKRGHLLLRILLLILNPVTSTIPKY